MINKFNLNIIENGDMASNISSETIDLTEITHLTAQMSWTGTSPSGAIQIFFSCDGINFNTTGAVLASSITGNLGNLVFSNFTARRTAPYAQIRYLRTSGSGTLNVILTGKELTTNFKNTLVQNIFPNATLTNGVETEIFDISQVNQVSSYIDITRTSFISGAIFPFFSADGVNFANNPTTPLFSFQNGSGTTIQTGTRAVAGQYMKLVFTITSGSGFVNSCVIAFK